MLLGFVYTFFVVTADDQGTPYVFKPGDVIRIKVFEKKACDILCNSCEIDYCLQCTIGKAAKENCLNSNESVFEAVAAFETFIKNCSKTCPHVQ